MIEIEEEKTLTVVVFGRTGSGKSSLCNLILAEERFEVGHSLVSQTNSVDSEVLTWPIGENLRIKIVDTPGFADNRPEMTNELLLKNILGFLKSMKNGLHIAIYCLPAKARIDQYDTQELEMLGLLLGNAFFDHYCIAITQLNGFTDEGREKISQNFIRDLLGILHKKGLPPFPEDRILFADFENFEERFIPKLTDLIINTTSYVPELSEEIDVDDSKSIKRFLAKPEMQEAMDYYKNLLAAQKKEMERVQEQLAEQAKENQQLIIEQRQDLKRMEDNLERAVEESKSAKNQSEVQKKKLEDYQRQEKINAIAHRKKITSIERKNDELQTLMKKKEDDMKALSDKLEQLQLQQVRTVYVGGDDSDDDDGPCNIF